MKKRSFVFYGLFIFCAILLSSCASHKQLGKELVIFPAPPDTARIQFLKKFSNSADIERQRGWFAKYFLGFDRGKPLNKPYGVAIYKGVIYITDSYFRGFAMINLEKGTFDYFVPSGLGQLKEPINCFVDENGNLYVADVGRLQIVVFDRNRNYIRAFGLKPDDKGWIIGMRNPRMKGKDDEIMATIELKDMAVSTSGDYERYFIMDGKRYHHILDPKTGYPSESGLISTTIITDSSIVADALSTSTFVLGLDKSLQLINSLKGVDAVFITSDKKIYITPGIKNDFTFDDESKEFEYVEKR